MAQFEYEVVIPAWNAAAFLAETLDSLRNQTHPPQRITVVDDGSTDDTAAISAAAGSTVLRTSHIGVVGARNLGLQGVTTPYVAFVDADDVWLPHFAARQADCWPNAGAMVAAVGSLIEPFGEGDLSGWQERVASGGLHVLSAQEVWDRNPLTASAIMFRSDTLQAVGGWREGLTPTDDYDLTLRLVSNGFQVALLQEVLARYRVRSGSWSSRSAASLVSEERALRDFWSSEFRRAQLPAVELEPRLRVLWWRTIARAAHYRQDLRDVPPAPATSEPTAVMRIARLLLRSPVVASLVAAAWRWWRRVGARG